MPFWRRMIRQSGLYDGRWRSLRKTDLSFGQQLASIFIGALLIWRIDCFVAQPRRRWIRGCWLRR
jgi:hypothetical protein